MLGTCFSAIKYSNGIGRDNFDKKDEKVRPEKGWNSIEPRVARLYDSPLYSLVSFPIVIETAPVACTCIKYTTLVVGSSVVFLDLIKVRI